jgi:hypothetical protein
MKKYLIAAIAALLTFGFAAFAASLTVDAGTLQAGSGSIGECVAGNVAVGYDDPVPDNGAWLIEGITLTPGAGSTCDGLNFSVVVSGDVNPDTPVKTGTFASGSGSVEYTGAERFDANDATDVHIAIHNAPPTP